ncbi:hypothetical protein [Roseicyclus mahoneyensis]|jgi:hypothetical protein|uniref:Uncharacterized protein n=1 Tax=Roseicyclus mahoneyensis TaxID=164332 RepID=A0A316G1A4_9RHOB|nr:hypothetical protein [Roseicyclus mahoneyensis]PWK54701.1 hypothetical protein C7455_1271 [Roseicyclus mahoneyensis]
MWSLVRTSLCRIGFGAFGAAIAFAAPAVGNGSGEPAPLLPFSSGRSFADLDTYLAHLQELGTMGIPWFQLLPDGRYMLVQRRPPGEAPEIFTRQDLLDRFGFAR